MIETHHLKDAVIFIETILSFMLSRKSFLLFRNIYLYYNQKKKLNTLHGIILHVAQNACF